MQDYRKLNWYRVCELWAAYEGKRFAAYLAGYITRNQMGVVNRKYPSGRQVTEAEARRFFQSSIRKHPLYPPDRPATLTDFKRIRASIQQDLQAAEMI